jgi:hypothetical protein
MCIVTGQASPKGGTLSGRRASKAWVFGAALVLALTMTHCTRDAAPAVPALRMAPEGVVLQLPLAMRRALDTYAPNFEPWHWEDYAANVQQHVRTAEPPWGELPMFGVVGDFNGDGRPDVALSGHDARRELLFILLSEGERYRAVELEPPRPWRPHAKQGAFMHRVSPGRLEVPEGWEEIVGPPPVLTADGVGWEYEGQAGGVYYWKDGRFLFYATSD